MSESDLLITAAYGVLLLITFARVVIAFSLETVNWRPLAWVCGCLGAALYLEVTTPVGASLDGVMRGLISLIAWVL